MYVFVLSSSINGLCHYTGYKNFANTATNIRSLALLTGGEGLHNNHHGFPRSPKFSFRPSEFDPAWPVIKLLTLLKLAQPYKTIEQSRSRSRKLARPAFAAGHLIPRQANAAEPKLSQVRQYRVCGRLRGRSSVPGAAG